jgi:hypothetical protein
MGMGNAAQFNSVGQGNQWVTQQGDINVFGQPPEPRRPVRERIRVVMLAANPHSTARLAIDEEARQITERLRLSLDRDAFELITCWAVRPRDLPQYLNQHRPHIVHFSGHGGRAGEIALSDGDGGDKRVSADALGELFQVGGDGIRVVVLNACHSAAAVRAIGPHVDYVLGMRAPVTDEESIVFAASFYSALGFRRPVPQAFAQAVAELSLHGLAGRDIPELVARPNANPYLTKDRDER